MELLFRRAEPKDADEAPRLIYSAGVEGFDYLLAIYPRALHVELRTSISRSETTTQAKAVLHVVVQGTSMNHSIHALGHIFFSKGLIRRMQFSETLDIGKDFSKDRRDKLIRGLC